MPTAQEKGKRARTDDMEVEGGEPIHPALIKKLHDVLDEIEKVKEGGKNEVLKLIQKYYEIQRPFYVQCNEVIQKIPDFWLSMFLSHPTLGKLLTEDDLQIFKHLESIDVVESVDVNSITFAFSFNPYFEDKRLTKTYSTSDDGTISVKATSIRWKTGMDIVNGKTCMRNGDIHLLVGQSFFTWFSDKKDTRLADDEVDEVAEIIMEDLWPNPLKFVSNESEDVLELEDEDDTEIEGEEVQVLDEDLEVQEERSHASVSTKKKENDAKRPRRSGVIEGMMGQYLQIRKQQIEDETAQQAKEKEALQIRKQQIEDETTQQAKEKEASQAADFSIKRCIALLNTMDVMKVEKAKAYAIFKNVDNREIFLCSCEEDQESTLIWLRSEMA